jgi:hypothetical protein
MNRSIFLVFSIFLSSQVFSQTSPKWNVEKPTGPSKSLTFQTNEGTWMNLDVSPDGQEIVFD